MYISELALHQSHRGGCYKCVCYYYYFYYFFNRGPWKAEESGIYFTRGS